MTETVRIDFKIRNIGEEQKIRLTTMADAYAIVFNYIYGIASMLGNVGGLVDAKTLWQYAGYAAKLFPCVKDIPEKLRAEAFYDALSSWQRKWKVKPFDGRLLVTSWGRNAATITPDLLKASLSDVGDLNVWMIDRTDDKAAIAKSCPVSRARTRIVSGTGIVLTLEFDVKIKQ